MNEPIRNKHSNIITYLFSFSAFIIIVYSIACFWSQNKHIELFLNPDVLTQPLFAHALVYNHAKFFDLHFSNSPSFFPDFAIIYFLSLFIKNAYSIFPIVAFIQITFFFLVIFFLYKSITKSNIGIRLGILSILIFLLVLAKKHSFSVYGNYEYLNIVLLPYFHFSAILLSFLNLYLFINVLFHQKNGYLIPLSLLIILGGISDPFTHFDFTFPAMLSLSFCYFFKYIDLKKYLYFSIFLIFLFITSYLIYRYVPLPFARPHLKMHFNFNEFKLLATTLLFNFIGNNLTIGIPWLLFTIFAPISLIHSHTKKTKDDSIFNILNFILLFEVVVIYLGLFVITITSPLDPNITYQLIPLRYFGGLIIGGALLGFPLLVYKYIKQIYLLQKNILFVSILFLLAVIALFPLPKLNFQNLFAYYPKMVACFDQYANKYKLKNGIGATFFESHVFTVYSRAGIQVANVQLKNSSVQGWDSNTQFKRIHNYNFVVMQDDSYIKHHDYFNTMIKRFGKPDHQFICANYNNRILVDVYVYNNKLKNLYFH